MSKTSGPSRIPKFGSRLPQIQSKTNDLTSKNIGQKVRLGDKEGILKFVGPVNFASGIWCGIELYEPVGKNDGFVHGVRYFACPPLRGLMAPLNKITLIEGSCESLTDDQSGPYSMLFTAQQIISNETFGVNNESLDDSSNLDETLIPTIGNNETFVESNSAKFNINNTYEIDKASEESCNKTSNNGLTFIQKINKSCENLIHDITSEVKRRRTSNPKSIRHDDTIEKPSSLPQLRNFNFAHIFSNVENTSQVNPPLNCKFSHSTPLRSEISETLFRKLQLNSTSETNSNFDDSSKRDSLEFEESLGILTPDQMIDGMTFASVSHSRSPSLEYVKPISEKNVVEQNPREFNLSEKRCEVNLELSGTVSSGKQELELLSPNLVDGSVATDYSLGIIDEHVLSNLTLKTDTTMNMELPLDTIDKSIDYTRLPRLEQTPSPEELPLDPTPIAEMEMEPKTEPSNKSKTTNSFITSITSITSLDTGYQGDGEMSRPASRGADNSPLTRRPIPRPQPRRQDPMTDSDFYTESDADNHEENVLKGDRKAQVIDGTLYGVDPQAAADIYVNNRENMDSSGIFTDIETRADELPVPIENLDVSPSDTSTKTISENSQNNLQEILDKNANTPNKLTANTTITKNVNNLDDKKIINKESPNTKKRTTHSPSSNSTPSSNLSPRHTPKSTNSNINNNVNKKFKMPNREVTSKVKSLLETNSNHSTPTIMSPTSGEKKLFKKPIGRWDAVMNKISKNEQNKNNLKDVKSKVCSNVNGSITNVNNVGSNVKRQTEVRSKVNARMVGSTKSPNNKTRRFRPRTVATTNVTASPKNGPKKKNVESSIHSSLSDLSANSAPKQPIIGSNNKRDVVQVTQVLTASKLSPKTNQLHSSENNKKNTSPANTKSNNVFPKEKKPTPTKECGRGTVKGGRTSPTVRPPTQTRAPAKQAPRVAEALAVLVQHLVFNVEAFKVPSLRRQTEKYRLEIEEIKSTCKKLEEKLTEERTSHNTYVENERLRVKNDVEILLEQHKNQIIKLNSDHQELQSRLKSDNETLLATLKKELHDQQELYRTEILKLQKTHDDTLDILREENDAIREQIDEQRNEVEVAKHESAKLKRDYETAELNYKKQIDGLQSRNASLMQQITKIDVEMTEKLRVIEEENRNLREENNRLLGYGDDKEIGIQEVQSLRAVLELKQNEVAELRRTLAEVTQRAEVLAGAEEKAAVLNARCEDLQLQLQRKIDSEQGLLAENSKLQDSFKEESNQKRRLSQYNEELQWKLKQSREVMHKVMEHTEDPVFTRSILSSSYNERHTATKHLERTLSFRERTNNLAGGDNYNRPTRKSKNDFEIDDELSPPSSPKVKGVVEKSDSVSYVLDLDESPDVVASRIVRRSFRNSTPPKNNTPTKSPSSSKRARIRNPLSLSSSTSAILTSSTGNCKMGEERTRSISVRNGDSDDMFVFMTTSTPKPYQSSDECTRNVKFVRQNSGDGGSELDEIDDDDHLELPALPSEFNKSKKVVLPSPKHLAGEAMISESNSEDESSTSSSQL